MGKTVRGRTGGCPNAVALNKHALSGRNFGAVTAAFRELIHFYKAQTQGMKTVLGTTQAPGKGAKGELRSKAGSVSLLNLCCCPERIKKCAIIFYLHSQNSLVPLWILVLSPDLLYNTSIFSCCHRWKSQDETQFGYPVP